MSIESEAEKSFAYRVENGEKIGSSTTLPKEGDEITDKYATPSTTAVDNIIAYNDDWAVIMRNAPFDDYQRILIVEIHESHVPPEDVTHDEKTDQGQIVIDKGIIKKVMTVNEWRDYQKELKLNK